MQLTRNKQLAMYALLATRSAYRAQLEGVPVKGSGSKPNPPASIDDLLLRFKAVTKPYGISSSDIQVLTDPAGPLGMLFDNKSRPPAQLGNITTDPVVIATALNIVYDPTDPDCPGYIEGNLISSLLIANLGPDKPDGVRPKVKYFKPKTRHGQAYPRK